MPQGRKERYMKSDFIPNWKSLGMESSQEGMMHVMKHLFECKDAIIARGFSSEVVFTLGENQFILKGKNKGRKKDVSG